MAAMIHAIINGRSYGVAAGFVLEEQIGNRTASSIQVLLGRQPLPSAGDIVDLVDTDAGRSVFWGVCSIVRRVGILMAPAGAVAELVCTNANALLSRRLVNLALRNKTVTQIVQALFDGYIAADGISLGVLSRFDLEVEVYTASDLNLQKALDELAELVGAGWNVTPDRKFVFIGKEDFPRLPVPLNNRSLPLFELSSACRDSDVRTVQIIKGSSQKTDPQLEAHVYNGRASEFVLSFPLSQRPNITVNGAAVSENAVGINGLNSGDASKAFLFSFQSPTVIYNPSNTVLTLAKGDTVEFEYVGFFPIRVENADSARIREVRAATGTSGIIENVSVSHSLTAWSDA
ncbi:MAG: hypothetical protein IJC25_01875, partial [Clostridia bacterium]|nr:hypothetical protein [Clostridia bacterium]